MSKRQQRRSASEWASIVAEWNASGQSAREFAASRGVKAATLSWWCIRLRSMPASSESPKPATFTEVRVATRSPSEGRIELVARSGHVIRVQGSVDPVALRALLEAVERC